MQNFLTLRNTLFIVGALTLWRLYLSAALQLHPDEAYYWMWSRNLDYGYYDHPPMVAYFIWLTTLFAKSELWVRLSGTLVTLAASVLTWKLARQMFGSIPVAAGSVILFNVYPLTMPGLIVITPDIPLYLFSALTLYLFWQAIHSRKAWLWYALGIAFGLALLSKYTALLLLPGLFFYLLFTNDRHWLKTPHPWLATLLGIACFLPVVVWNAQHDWISFRFQFQHGLGDGQFDPLNTIAHFTSQMLLLGPLAWLLGMYAAVRSMTRHDKAMLFLLCTALPVILFFGYTSLNKLAGPNWPAFAYFSFGILLTQYFLGSASRLKHALWYGALLSSLLISSIITLHAAFSVLPLARYAPAAAVADTTNWFYGWRELGAELQKHPQHGIAIAHSHQLAAEIAYYTDERFSVTTDDSARPSQFSLWPRADTLHGSNGVYLWTADDAAGPYANYFRSSGKVYTLPILRAGTTIREYHIVTGTHYMPPAAAGPLR